MGRSSALHSTKGREFLSRLSSVILVCSLVIYVPKMIYFFNFRFDFPRVLVQVQTYIPRSSSPISLKSIGIKSLFCRPNFISLSIWFLPKKLHNLSCKQTHSLYCSSSTYDFLHPQVDAPLVQAMVILISVPYFLATKLLRKYLSQEIFQ